MTEFKVVGHRIGKPDSRSKATGHSRYFDDLSAPGMIYARLVRSTQPHARVRSVDISAALASPGVLAVLSGDNLEEMVGEVRSFDPACHEIDRSGQFAAQPGDSLLFDPIVRFVGQPVALVIAETDRAALSARSLVRIKYDDLPAVVTLEEAAREGAPQLHEGGPKWNVVDTFETHVGDVDDGLASSVLVVTRDFQTGRQKQAQMEPTGCLVTPQSDGAFDISSPHQAPHRARITLSRMFGIPQTRLRLLSPEIGGAFGKGDALTAEPYGLAASLATGRPVKVRFDRSEDFVGTESRHPVHLSLKLGVDGEGVIQALKVRGTVDAGAYRSHTPRVLRVIAGQFLATYGITNADISVIARFTNSPIAGAFRGYGGPQAVFALECILDLAARQLEIDPVEIRRRNMPLPGTSWGPKARPLDNAGFEACLELGSQAFGWSQRDRSSPSSRLRRGYGMACTAWKSGVAGKPGAIDHSGATVHLNSDGTVELRTAASDLGTGIKTTLGQICAEALGIAVDDVRVSQSDTASTPFDSGAFGSRSLYRCGQAVFQAAIDARQKLLTVAGRFMEADPGDLTISDGRVHVTGAPERALGLEELLLRALDEGIDIQGEGYTEVDNAITHSAHFAEVQVDIETGFVRVVRLVAAQDVGKAINPTIVEGQIQGGAWQGLGYALWEDLLLDDGGTVINGTFMDYRLPYVSDGPDVETVVVEVADPSGPYGAKGAGEPSVMLPAPAVANAILDAVGLSPTRIPFTPERVLAAVDEAFANRHIGK